MTASQAPAPTARSSSGAPEVRGPAPHGRRSGWPPAAVWALVALQLLLGVGWSLLAPTYRAPDETQHVDLVLQVARGEPYPDAFDRMVGTQVTATSARANLSRDGTPLPERDLRFPAGEAPARTDRPSFAAFGPDQPTAFGNQMPQHPPLYYLLAGGVIAALPEATAFDVQIWLLRVLGAVLVAPLPLLIWLAARRVLPDRRMALAAAALPLAIPQLAHIAGSVSNDPLLLLTLAVSTLGVAGVLGGDVRLRTAVLLWGATTAALLTKGFALYAPVVVVAAYALLAWRRRRAGAPLRPLLPAAVVAIVGPLVSGGWWYVRNLRLYGTPQPDAFPFTDLPDEIVIDFGFWLPYIASRFTLRFWGQLGWVEVPLPYPLVWTLAAAVTAGIAFALLHPRSRIALPEAVVLLLPVAGLGAIVLYGALRFYLRTGVPAGVQGRYFYPALVGMAVLAAAGGVGALGRSGRWLAPGVLAVGLAVQAIAGILSLAHWYGPAGAPGMPLAVRGLLAWSPVPPGVVAVVAGALLLSAVAALTALLVTAVRQRPSPRRETAAAGP